MIGNLITGSTFGWIFWKRGLLIAINAHTAFNLAFSRKQDTIHPEYNKG